MRIKLSILCLFTVLLMSVLPAMGQGMQYDVLVDGLNNPRGISFSDSGVLYVAESGLGGDSDVIGPFGPAKMGFTGRVSVVVDGEASVLIDYLPSMDMNGDVVGPMDVVVANQLLWVVMGHEIAGVTLAGTVVTYDRINLRPTMIFDVFGYEHRYDPDSTGELLSNPASVSLAPDGMSALIADASGNAIYEARYDGALDLVRIWETNPVPTSVAYNADGSQYAVGVLSSFPFTNGSAWIEVYDTATTDTVIRYDNLTAITDVMFDDDGVILAVVYGEFDLDVGEWKPNTGGVIAITPDGVVPVLIGLNFPYSIAKHPTDNWYAVSVNSLGEAGTGAIIHFSLGG